MIKPKDYFSEGAVGYKRYRPAYPKKLYQHIYTQLSGNSCAWDCATGNGQVATALAKHFEKVYATDISQPQLSLAPKKENIAYEICRAEETYFSDNSFDLITVAQALHWFDGKHFFEEVHRVIKPSGILAIWGYGLPTFSHEIDALLNELCNQILAEYWDFDRSPKANQSYGTKKGFEELAGDKDFSVEKWMSLSELQGYLYTWSAVTEYMKHNPDDPVKKIMEKIRKNWGDTQQLSARFSIFLKLRRSTK
ncbi:MAG: class I SAM-dependent methyltransferase [Bacteroidota bacterium]